MQKYFFKCFLFIITISILIILSDEVSEYEVYCKSATVRNVTDFNQLQNCTVVTGFVRIVEVDFTPKALKQLNFSHVEEISEYLLVYRVKGLDSLERLFPNLMIIRGVELWSDQYALMVIENPHLQDIGLLSLLRVLRGSIRIESNPSLCFTNTVNWPLILGLENKKYLFDIRNNKSPNQCPLCYTYEDVRDTKMVNHHKRCWSYGKFQRDILDYVGDQACYTSNCLNSCYIRNCLRCVNYVSQRGCEESCLPPRYKLAYKRQCVTNCTEWGLVQLGMECVEKCPRHYNEVDVNGENKCASNCEGNVVINRIEDLEGLADCATINGSLTIEIHETNTPIVQHLEDAFSNLQEITGYLKIVKSPQIIALHFLQNLHMIWGLELLENKYSLYVVDNKNLQELWPENVAIVHGCIYFHLNPHLCYDKITDLQKNFKECRTIGIADVSVHSNGERAVCSKGTVTLNATVTDVNSNAAVVEVRAMDSSELVVLIGYVNYYKEAPFKNITKHEGRHGCGADGWFTDVFLKQHRRHIIKNLKPNTQYAYFVQSLMAMEYRYSLMYVSEIQYFQTLPTKPGTVAKLYSLALSPTDLEIHWWPPIITNGILDKYILQYEVTNAATTSDTVEKKMRDMCRCPKLDIESHVATPHVEEYYSREKMLYINSLLNLIFVKKRIPVNTTPQNATVLEATESKRNETEFEATESKLNASEFEGTASKHNETGLEITESKRNGKELKATESKLNATKQAASEPKRNDTKSGKTESKNDAAARKKRAIRTTEELEKQLDEDALREQDEDKESYVIPHSSPICNNIDPNIQEQLEKQCVPLERFKDATEIPSNVHFYNLYHLEPGKTYRISLRACVKGLANGCGAEKVIFAQTANQRLEQTLESVSYHKI